LTLLTTITSANFHNFPQDNKKWLKMKSSSAIQFTSEHVVGSPFQVAQKELPPLASIDLGAIFPPPP
jgi:hypothetical protein